MPDERDGERVGHLVCIQAHEFSCCCRRPDELERTVPAARKRARPSQRTGDFVHGERHRSKRLCARRVIGFSRSQTPDIMSAEMPAGIHIVEIGDPQHHAVHKCRHFGVVPMP